jgi:hypothetical protein
MVETTLKRFAIATSLICLVSATGVAAGGWAVGDASSFYRNRPATLPDMPDRAPVADDFWRMQQRQAAPRIN